MRCRCFRSEPRSFLSRQFFPRSSESSVALSNLCLRASITARRVGLARPVHRALLRDGTSVAVKVQRPDLDRLMHRDLDALELEVGGRLERSGAIAMGAKRCDFRWHIKARTWAMLRRVHQ